MNELKQMLTSYLDNSITMNELESWIVTNLQKIIDTGDKKLNGIVDSLDAYLVEIGEGIVTEEEFRGIAQDYLNILSKTKK